MSEREMLDRLHRRYTVDRGNGPRFAFAEHVKSAAGHDAPRCADFVAMDLWPAQGLPLHGHEVKVSRSDWLTELANPAKAEAFRPYMDYWWLVVPEDRIVRGDLPDGWGLMVAAGRSVRVRRPAPRNRAVLPLPREMLAPLLRSIAKTSRRAATAELSALVVQEDRP